MMLNKSLLNATLAYAAMVTLTICARGQTVKFRNQTNSNPQFVVTK